MRSLEEILTNICSPPNQELEFLRGFITDRNLKRGQIFVRAGEPADEVAFVRSGSLRKFYTGNNGREFIRRFARSGDFIAPYGSLLKGEPSNVTIEAVEESSLYVIQWRDYQDLLSRHPCWVNLARKIAESLYVEKEEKEADSFLLSTAERYEKFRCQFGKFSEKIPQHYIASYLGVTPAALSRIVVRKKLRGTEP